MNEMSGFSLQTFFDDIRSFLYGGIQSFPLTLAGSCLLLGMMTANYAMMFFVVGLLIIVPVVAFFLNIGADLLFNLDFVHNLFSSSKDWFKVSERDLCKLVYPFGTQPIRSQESRITQVSSYWLAMTVFFISYMMSNAVALYTMPADIPTTPLPNAKKVAFDAKVTTRTTQSLIAIISITIFALAILTYRLKYSGCETLGGVIWTLIIFGTLGYAWYKALATTGQNRLSDLFGIANRLLSPDAVKNEPVACLPVAN